MWQRLKHWAQKLRQEITALFIAGRDARTPRMAKLIAIGVVVYALSPIDLIPDFLPVVGYLDDVILLPAGIWLAVRLIPDDLMKEFRQTALTAKPQARPLAGIILVVVLWLCVAALLFYWLDT